MTCTLCSRRFNSGFNLNAGSVCAVCAGKHGDRLSPEDQRTVSNARSVTVGGVVEPAAVLASRLIKSLALAIIVPIIAAIAFYAMAFVVAFVASQIGGRSGLDVAGPSATIGMAAFVVIVDFVFFFRWLAVLENGLEATDNTRQTLHVTASFFVPLYGVFLTLYVFRLLNNNLSSSVSYGRLQIV